MWHILLSSPVSSNVSRCQTCMKRGWQKDKSMIRPVKIQDVEQPSASSGQQRGSTESFSRSRIDAFFVHPVNCLQDPGTNNQANPWGTFAPLANWYDESKSHFCLCYSTPHLYAPSIIKNTTNFCQLQLLLLQVKSDDKKILLINFPTVTGFV